MKSRSEAMQLSVLVITYNEAVNIEACLKSVTWADEIVVIDSGSTDETCVIARRYTDKVIAHPWSGYAAQKNWGHTVVSHEWILSLDADEVATPELESEIQLVLQGAAIPPEYNAYRIPIRDYMFGKFVRYGSWPHQTHIRLYRKHCAMWTGAVHESIQVPGKVGQLVSPLLHYSHTSLKHFIDKLNTYTDTEAQEMFERGKRGSLTQALLGATRAFVGQYVRLQGFRDGGHGLILALCMAFYYFITRAKLWSLWYLREHSQDK